MKYLNSTIGLFLLGKHHRRRLAMIRMAVLIAIVAAVAMLVTLRSVARQVETPACACGSFGYTDALAYKAADKMTITGAVTGASDTALFECFNGGWGISDSATDPWVIDKEVDLYSCGGLTNALVMPLANSLVQTGFPCGFESRAELLANGNYQGFAGTSSVSASFSTAGILTTRSSILDPSPNGECCTPPICGTANTSLSVDDTITITIPFSLCKEQSVMVMSDIWELGGCDGEPGSANTVTGTWCVGGYEGSYTVNAGDADAV